MSENLLDGLGAQLFLSRERSTPTEPDVPMSAILGNPRADSLARSSQKCQEPSAANRGLSKALESN